jgi:hypothetical protein
MNKYDENLIIDLKEEIYQRFTILANNPIGSNFIKKFITNFKKHEEVKLRLTNLIKENFNSIVQNQYGNIVLLTILNVK